MMTTDRSWWAFIALATVVSIVVGIAGIEYDRRYPRPRKPCADYADTPREGVPARCFEDFHGDRP